MKFLLIFALIIFSTGCIHTPTVEVSTTAIKREPLQVQEIDRYESLPIEWIVITPDNIEDFKSLNGTEGEFVLFGLEPKQYQNLTLNMSNLLKLVLQQKATIDAYKVYYAPSTEDK